MNTYVNSALIDAFSFISHMLLCCVTGWLVLLEHYLYLSYIRSSEVKCFLQSSLTQAKITPMQNRAPSMRGYPLTTRYQASRYEI
jgi:hypothetical protein